MALALLLATPIFSFNAISTRDQVARLESGRTLADKFDWRAGVRLRRAGQGGARAVERSSNAAIARLARDASTQSSRYEIVDIAEEARSRDTLDQRVRVMPAGVTLSPELKAKLTDYDACGRGKDDRCTLLYRPGAAEAIVMQHRCIVGLAVDAEGARVTGRDCDVTRMKRVDGTWTVERFPLAPERDAATRAAIVAGVNTGAIEVRSVSRRQVFVGGHPVGDAFE